MKKILLTLGFSLFAFTPQAQTITTIAGGGSSLGDGGAAADCQINHSVGITLDHAGNIYLTDRDNHRIRKIATTGIITTIAGTGVAGFGGDGGPASLAQISYPYGIAIDGSGNIYFSDAGNVRIRKIAASGIITTIAGDGTMGSGGNGGPATLAQLDGVGGIAIDKIGNILLAEQLSNKVRMISNAGIISTIAGTGSQGHTGDAGAATLAKLYSPYGIAIDSSGNVYISEDWGSDVRKIDNSGIISTVAGTGVSGFSGDNGPATIAMLSRVMGIAVDADGNLYIGDYTNRRIRKINNYGIITTLAGTGIAGFNGDGPVASTQLAGPCCFALDGQANLLFSDFPNNRIRKVSSTLGLQQWVAEGIAISIYPNPTNGPLNISLPARASHVDIVIANALGQIVKHYNEQDVDNVKMSISLPSGLYFISVTSPAGTYSQKITVL